MQAMGFKRTFVLVINLSNLENILHSSLRRFICMHYVSVVFPCLCTLAEITYLSKKHEHVELNNC